MPVIGVGEATTPLLPQFLHADLGLDVHRLFREVRPTLKLGIRFLWGTGDGFSYPFGPLALAGLVEQADPTDPADSQTAAPSLDESSLGAALMAAGRLPIVPVRVPGAARPEVAAGPLRSGLGTEVAYHLDNRRFTTYLAARTDAAGVTRIRATVARVEPAADGSGVAALHTADGRRLAFDLYVDCSGFRSLLMGETLGEPFAGYDRSLFTDGALIGCVRRPVGPNGALAPHTTAATREAGWSWTIPQEGEDHVGSVFCSAFTTPQSAEAELHAAHPGLDSVRALRFRSGRRARFWRDNVVALGNAYGFVEPLESTAIHLAIRQILLLIDHLPLPGEPAAPIDGRALQERLNRRVAAHWDYVAWFLALHFKYNRRLDTPFWRACREEVDVSRYAELIEEFRAHGPLSCREDRADGFPYPDPLWGPEGIDVVLLGQGVPWLRQGAPGVVRASPATPASAALRQRRAGWRDLAERSLGVADALRLLGERPELLEGLAEAFRRRGPASALLGSGAPGGRPVL